MRRLKFILYIFLFLTILASCNSKVENSKEVNTEKVQVVEDEDFDFKEYIEDYIWKEAKEVFSPYYELLGFKVEEYEENYTNGVYDAVFNYKIIYKNYDKNPDTVPYISEAKKEGTSNYIVYYKEYLENKEMNILIRAIKYDEDGVILYGNISPKEEMVWIELELSDFLINN